MVVTVMLICSLVVFWGKSRSSVEGIKCNKKGLVSTQMSVTRSS